MLIRSIVTDLKGIIMDLSGLCLDFIDDGTPHDLLEPPSPAYSNVTVRRAFIVWMYCGQTNKFKDVCNYYHYLETLEEKLPLDQRATSRHHEFNMFCNPPPTTPYLHTHHPKLYSNSTIEPNYIKKLESIRNDKCLFKLEGFNEIRQKGVTTAEIIEASQIIRMYCKTQLIPLKRFLEEYKAYANSCGLPDTVYNVAAYIKRKMVQAELETIASCPQNFSFLNDSEAVSVNDSDKPKLFLGTNETIAEKNEDEGRYKSCDEFFKSFKPKTLNTYAPLTPSTEDFVKLFDQDRLSYRSVENQVQRKADFRDTLHFTSQEHFDSNLMKKHEFNRLRKI